MEIQFYNEVGCLELKDGSKHIFDLKQKPEIDETLNTKKFINLGYVTENTLNVKRVYKMKAFEHFIYRLEPEVKREMQLYLQDRNIDNPSENHLRWLMIVFTQPWAKSNQFRRSFRFDKVKDKIHIDIDYRYGDKVKNTYTHNGLVREVYVYSQKFDKEEYIDFKDFWELIDTLKEIKFFYN
tara:strand:- start:1337 stop:1882 length:546 start_codon:yes stop_codon:yes gene_type:complete